MKISKKLVSFVLMLVAVVTFSFTAVTLTKAKAETAFVMDDKAVIRVIAPESEGKNTYGIGFRAKVTEPVDGAYYNMMIIPENYVEAYETAVETKDETRDIVTFMLDKKADADAAEKNMPLAIATNLKVDQDGYITGGLVNIKYENLNVNFYGFGYYELGDDVVNATPATVEDAPTYSRRSIAEVASNAILSGDYDNATGDTLEELKDIQNIYMQSIKQNSGVEEDDAAATAPNLTLNYSNAKTYIRGTVDLNSANGVADGLINWSSNTPDVATVDADGVIVGKSAGTATITAKLFDQVTATCDVTVDPIEVANADNVSVNVESATKGSVTLTSKDGASYGTNSSYVAIRGDYTDQFIKVGFTTPATAGFAANTLGLGSRSNIDFSTINHAASGATALYFTMQPSPYGGGYRFCANGQALYIADGNDDMWKLQGNTFGLAASTDYYFIYGVIDNPNGSCNSDAEKDYNIYFAILDANENVLVTLSTSKSHAEAKSADNLAYFGQRIADSGSFIITSALTAVRTITYEILDKETALGCVASNVTAPTITQAKNVVSWSSIAWADGYKYRVDSGEWQETVETSFELGMGTHKVEVKAFNADIESAGAILNYLYTEDDIVIKDATDISFTNLTHESGYVTFTNVNSGGSHTADGGTELWLKKQYGNELIKFKFVANGYSWYDQKTVIGLRQATDSPAHYLYTWVIDPRAEDFGVALRRLSTNDMLYPFDGGYGEEELVGSDKSFSTMLTPEITYYAVAGVFGTGDEVAVYFGIQDSNGEYLKLSRLTWSKISARKASTYPNSTLTPFSDTGYFAIHDKSNPDGTGFFEYSFVSAPNPVEVYNAASSNISYDSTNGITTAKITANSGASATNAAYITDFRVYADKFVKIGFEGVAGSFASQQFSIGVRRNSLSAASNSAAGYQTVGYTFASGLGITSNGSKVYANYTDSNSSPYYGKVVYGTWSSMISSSAFSESSYYMYMGAVGTYAAATDAAEASDTKIYIALSQVVENVEIIKWVVEFSYIEDVLATKAWADQKAVETGKSHGDQWFGNISASGHLPLWSWSTTEKEFTYQIVDNSVILDLLNTAE